MIGEHPSLSKLEMGNLKHSTDFRQVYAEYFRPANRVVAELSTGEHSLLVWYLHESNRYAGQYYVRVEGKTLLDDVPSPERARLRRLLEAIRAGRLSVPGP